VLQTPLVIAWRFATFYYKMCRGLLCADNGGRYAFSKQPEICKWNCVKLAEALFLLAPMQRLVNAVESFDEIFQQHYMQGMRKKVETLSTIACVQFSAAN